jgi:transcriptional regulator with XRE-family HTH domain
VTAPVQVGPSSSHGGPAPFEDLEEYLGDIGDRIRAEREARGLTEVALAERAGVDRGTVRRIQDGIGTLRAFAQVSAGLGVGMDYLLSNQWVMPERPGGSLLSPRQVAVLRAAASGDSLSVVGARLGMGSRAVSSDLSRIYQRLGVTGVPREGRRSAAVRVAMQHGLFDAA